MKHCLQLAARQRPVSHLAENTWTKQTARQPARPSGWLMSPVEYNSN